MLGTGPAGLTLVAELARRGPFDETFMTEYAAMFYQHTTPQNMDSSAFEEAFGVRPTPLRDGISATVAWYRQMLAGGEPPLL